MKVKRNFTNFLLSQYARMSGDKKIQIAMRLSDTVRKVNDAGNIATNTKDEQWRLTNKTFSSQ